MAKRSNPVIDAITNPAKNFLAFFLVGTLLFGVFADGISALFWDSFGKWLQGQLGLTNPAELRAWVSLFLFGIILVIIYASNISNGVRWLLGKLKILDAVVPEQASVVPLTETCQGLIAIMSLKDDSPAEIAIRHHWNNGEGKGLKHCWLICTHKSRPYADAMYQRLIAEGIGGEVSFHYGDYKLRDRFGEVRSLTVDEQAAQEPDSILQVVNAIYIDATAKGLDESDVIVDFTGGTKPLGVGAFLACTSPDRRLEYLKQDPSPSLVEVKVSYTLKPLKSR
ncbi:MAG: CRISPR-associated protein [Phormidesmis priestleyi]|uniref:CRISPR-associated protein n=1 Tax=Phormidesmis priestleyi TaxID=268141 RepID=A0A2W4WIR4_9CYAN|nr:MAG: CRISPR-associated protein [Phormidesmis priestleyi]